MPEGDFSRTPAFFVDKNNYLDLKYNLVDFCKNRIVKITYYDSLYIRKKHQLWLFSI